MKKYKVVDLFAGAGGLSLGFKKFAHFDIVLAVENNRSAQATYKSNHPGVVVLSDIREVNFEQLRDEIGQVDVVIGGPPCQGFSNANRQKAHLISRNNGLVKEYVRAVVGLKPTVFVMENVSMLKSETHRFYKTWDDVEKLTDLDLDTRYEEVDLFPGIILESESEDILSLFEHPYAYLWPTEKLQMLSQLNRFTNNRPKFDESLDKFMNEVVVFLRSKDCASTPYTKQIINQLIRKLQDYYLSNLSFESLQQDLEKLVGLQKMMAGYIELIENNVAISKPAFYKGKIYVEIESYAILDYIEQSFMNAFQTHKPVSSILNALDFGAPQKRERFIMIGSTNDVKPSLPKGNVKTASTVRDAIEDLENIEVTTDIHEEPKHYRKTNKISENPLRELRNSDLISNHVVTASRSAAMTRFRALKQGQNFHDLDDSLKSSYSDPSRTQNTVYMRLKYDEPCGTVLNVRKSMWVHPALDRALSIREAARLQTFPDDFVFFGKKDDQYQQVGNAVPPILATAIAEQTYKILERGKV